MDQQTERPFSSMEALRFGWATTREHLRPLLILGAVGAFLALLNHSLTQPSPNPGVAPILALAVQLLEAALMMVYLRVALMLHDRRPVDFARPQVLLADFFTYLLTTLLVTLIVLGGFLLLIVPGVLWGLKFGYAPFLVADGKTDPMDALRESARVTRGVRKQLFGFALLILGLNILGSLAFGVGLLVTVPTGLIAAAYVLRRLQTRAASLAPREAPPTQPTLPTAPPASGQPAH